MATLKKPDAAGDEGVRTMSGIPLQTTYRPADLEGLADVTEGDVAPVDEDRDGRRASGHGGCDRADPRCLSPHVSPGTTGCA